MVWTFGDGSEPVPISLRAAKVRYSRLLLHMSDIRIFWTYLANRFVEDQINVDADVARRIWLDAVLNHYDAEHGEQVVIPEPHGGWPEPTKEEKGKLKEYVDDYRERCDASNGSPIWTMQFRLAVKPPVWIPDGAILVDPDFSDLDFSNTVTSFVDVWFVGKARFDRAVFRGGVHLSGSSFTGNASFKDVTFSGNSTFRNVRFFDGATFHRAKFDDVSFLGAQFFERFSRDIRDGCFYSPGPPDRPLADFGEANFSGRTSFQG